MIDFGAADNTVGGTTASARNVISANITAGVDIAESGTSGNVIEGDYIGTDVAGTHAMANLVDGVEIEQGSSGNTIGGTSAARST